MICKCCGKEFTPKNEPHRLLCGDATEPADAETIMAGAKADMVWSDAPYGVAVASRVGVSARSSAEARALNTKQIENDDLSLPELTEFLRAAFCNFLQASKPGACWYMAAPHGPIGLAFSVTLNEIGVWRHSLVWVKDSLVMSRMDYHYRHEPIYYGWTPGGPHRAVPTRDQDTVWEFPRPKRSELHPTMKPVALIERAIVNSSDAGDIVIDFFGGSGSTLIACERTRRNCRMIELSPAYADVIVTRWQAMTGESAKLEACGRTFEEIALQRRKGAE